MNQEKIKNSLFLKAFCTLILPIFIFGIIFSIAIMSFQYEYPEIEENPSFYESENFKDTYLSYIISSSRRDITIKSRKIVSDAQTEEIEYVSTNKFAAVDGTIYYDYNQYLDNFIYLIINETTQEAFTNIEQTTETDTIAKIKDKISQKKYHWIYTENSINTDINKLSEENIKYNNTFETAKKNLQGKSLYTYIDENEKNDLNKVIYNTIAEWNDKAFQILVISSVITIAISIYLCVSIGHKYGTQGVYLDKLAALPLEVLIFIITIILTLSGGLIALSCSITENNCEIGIKILLFSIYIFIELCLISLGIFIKKVKAKQFFKSSLTYKCLKWTKNKIKNIIKFIKDNLGLGKKVGLIYWGFILISLILILMAENGIAVIILIALWIWGFKQILDYRRQLENVKSALKNIYEGNTNIELNKEELCNVLKEMSEYIEDIAGGFSNAIEGNLKNERMKTELITNVSHDIKTPLTSIINYVDLLKKEDIENEKVKEYLQILDNKSQRLKKLIEDLVEASKASSGNIKLNKEKIDVKELVKQVTGEFEDKFNSKGLEIITDFSKENMEILADNRYMYRIIENIYSNVAKYALDNSRVYVDLMVLDNHKIISVKNISKEKLNISPEELIQRFVRGDKSRNTEGSGLGLSIAKSLTELQGGIFNIYVDGDLFKIIIEF